MDKIESITVSGKQGVKADNTISLWVALAAGFLFSYYGVIGTLAGAWWNNSVYSHGFLVPLASLYAAWAEKGRLSNLAPSPSKIIGPAILASGLLLLIAGDAAGVVFVQELSIVITIAGLVAAVLGLAFLRALWFPIAYLLLMLRFWEFLTAKLHLPFQNFSAFLGTKILNLIGIPAFRESIYIELPNITLQVAEVCSGVNYLISVLALGIMLAYLTISGLKKRVLLVCLGLLIAVLANGLRVALIGFLSFHNLSGDIHGPFHVLQAMFVAAAGFAGLFVGTWALSDRKGAVEEQVIEKKSFRLKWTGAVPAVCLLLLGGAYMSFHKPAPVEPLLSLRSFPYEIGGWTGRGSATGSDLFKDLGVDYELSRVYKAGTEEVSLYIGYYTEQKQGKELINYKTRELDNGAIAVIISPQVGGPIPARKVSLSGSEKAVFWYKLNGKETSGRISSKLYTALDSILRNRTNGAVIIVSAKSGSDIEGFAKAIAPITREYLP